MIKLGNSHSTCVWHYVMVHILFVLYKCRKEPIDCTL